MDAPVLTQPTVKGTVPIPYVIAFVMAAIVVSFAGFMTLSGEKNFGTAVINANCVETQREYCSSILAGRSAGWAASCGAEPTAAQCKSGSLPSFKGTPGSPGASTTTVDGSGTTATCVSFTYQSCKSACDSDAVGTGLGSCALGSVCCLGKPPKTY